MSVVRVDAPDNSIDDVRPAVLAAWERARATGATAVELVARPFPWRSAGPLILPPLDNVRLVGPGTVRTGVTGSPFWVHDSRLLPAIALTGGDRVGIRDLSMALNYPPAPSVYGDDADFGGVISVDGCGDAEVLRVHVPDCTDGVVSGVVERPRGARRLVVRDCELNYRRTGVRVLGGYYLDIGGAGGPSHWQDNGYLHGGGSGVAVAFVGPLHASSTDGISIHDLFVEHCTVGVRVMNSNHSVANLRLRDLLLDGVSQVGIWVSPGGSGMAHIIDVNDVRVNAQGDAYPMIVEADGGAAVRTVRVANLLAGGTARPPVSIGGGSVSDVVVDGQRVR